MPKFKYQAFNDTGNPVSGVIEAESEAAANHLVAARGLIPCGLKKEKQADIKSNDTKIGELFTRIKYRDMILMTKQLRTMLKAGVPMIRLLQILEEQTENAKLRQILSSVAKNITEGSTIHDAFGKYRSIFSPLYCATIQAGEASGDLPKVLDRLIYIMEHEHKVKSDIRAALQYPMIVLSFLIFAFFFLLIFVIPKFVHVFKTAKITLPLPTQICILLYQLWQGYWFLLICGAVGLFVALNLYLRTEHGRFVRDSILLRIPVMGDLFIKSSMSRFASIFSIMQFSGVQVLESFRIISEAIGNKAISGEFDKIRDQIAKGSNISAPLKSAKYFTPMVVNMVAVGEKTEKLDEMLADVAQHYDSEVEYAMKNLSEYIGPLLTICMAVMVGFFALAIFMPMWDITKIANK